jgi:hypothetical protein
LTVKLERLVSTDSRLPEIVFLDSFLTNEQALKCLKGYNLKKVVTKPNGNHEISLLEGAKVLRRARLLILSADAILRNGGLLCTSGGLLLAVAAKELGVPVLAISRSYCLWEHIICSQ